MVPYIFGSKVLFDSCKIQDPGLFSVREQTGLNRCLAWPGLESKQARQRCIALASATSPPWAAGCRYRHTYTVQHRTSCRHCNLGLDYHEAPTNDSNNYAVLCVHERFFWRQHVVPFSRTSVEWVGHRKTIGQPIAIKFG